MLELVFGLLQDAKLPMHTLDGPVTIFANISTLPTSYFPSHDIIFVYSDFDFNAKYWDSSVKA